MGSVLLAGVATILSPAGAIGQTQQVEAQSRSFDIPAKSLTEVLADFGQQSGLQISVDAANVRDRSSPGVRGRLSIADALQRLLAGTGFTWHLSGNLVTLERVRATDGGDGQQAPIVTEALKIEGAAGAQGTGIERDAGRRDEVFDRDISSTFAGKDEVERYKGVNPADVLKGMVNVFSGDSRNSGALDPSIRGIQGPGRVPVIIDGTEQALTVWRGYNGASNRNYIDPSLIAGVEVLKGPVSVRGVNASTGGAVVINTLDVADILKPGRKFGIELHLEGGNNSVSPQLPTLHAGQDYRTIAGFPGSPGTPGLPNFPYDDPTVRVPIHKAGDNDVFSMGDKAVRVAAAGRLGDFDLIAAYAYRQRGNYYSGENGAGYYQQSGLTLAPDTYVRLLGLNYKPGEEVPNTSSEMESWLAKGTWHIAADQYLQLGFRDSKSTYGEIIPSRIISTSTGTFGNIQWPLSKVHAQSYNAEYKWQPDSKWIDLKASLWGTHTVSDTYSAGGFPNAASTADPILINTALGNSHNNRIGFTASNQVKLTRRLDLMLEGSWQHEKLSSEDQYSDAIANGWRQYPRAGRREEYRINLRGDWRPTSFLKLNASVTYSGYWAHDDFLDDLLQIRGGSIGQSVVSSYNESYQTTETGAVAYEAWLRTQFTNENIIKRRLAAYIANPVPFTVTHNAVWSPDAQGSFRRADNLCVNGSLTAMRNYVAGSCGITPVTTNVAVTQSTDKRAHDWAPSASATVYFSGASRGYVRYAEAYRFPSVFESTIGFSASINPTQALKPEHMYALEAAFVQDLKGFFDLNGTDQRADIKLTWYNNLTKDVIERSTQLMFFNLDRQEIQGLELQARYDNGRFFTELGGAHMTKNKVCDESFAIQQDPVQGRVPNCVKYGFVSSYLLTQATPEDQINWSVGGRFLQKRLEVGSRLTWYGGYDNPQLDAFISGPVADRISGYGLNVPYTWGEILTVDAYVKFRLNDRYSAELVGTNLNDRYYLDPLSRSLMPAPGRTVRLSLTGRF
jgi:hemoglobin/transferrin/lactoferrin receptor protein